MKRQNQLSTPMMITAVFAIILLIVLGFVYVKKYKRKSYKSYEYGISIKYPRSWSRIENMGGVAVQFMSPKDSDMDVFKENVNIVVQDISANPMGLQEYTDLAIKQMEVVFKDKIEVIESISYRLAGHEAHKFLYIGKGPRHNFKMMHVWTVVDDKAYQFTFTAIDAQFDSYYGQAENMLKSFRIL